MTSPLDDMEIQEIQAWLDENLVSPAMAAQMLGIAQVTVTQHLRKGNLESIKIGRSWGVSRASIYKWTLIEKNKGGRPKGGGKSTGDRQ